MDNVNYVQVVRQTWEERFKMYMKCTKKELASMLAEQAKYISPDSCKEFEPAPEWCGYPKELHCMSLARGYVNGEDFCKTCDAYKWQKK